MSQGPLRRLLPSLFKQNFSQTCYWSAKKKAATSKKANPNASATTTKYFGRPSNNLSAGIVGLANVGKSTFFQAVTKSDAGIAANYPFATIDPEKLLITIPSEKLDKLQKLYKSKKQIKATLSICDIAGLTKGASKGKGLGNQFLNDIRSVDGIFQVVRGFRNDNITHIEETVDPVRDLEIVNEELLLKDLDFVGTAIEQVSKKVKYNKSAQELILLKAELRALQKAEDCLLEGKRVATVGGWTDDEIEGLNRHNLLTAKSVTYLLNVSEEDYINQSNEFLESVSKWIRENSGQETSASGNDNLILFSAAFETKLKEMEMKEVEGVKSAIPEILIKMKKDLHLISFFTCGDIEAREWQLRQNSFAPDAAGIIHSDLQKTFISAEVIKYDDIKDEEPEKFTLSKLKSAGKIQRQGKLYIVEDGDIILIKAGAGKAR